MSKETENSEKIAQFGRALDFFKQRYLSDSSDVPTLRDAALKQFQLLQEQFDTFELNNLFLSDGEIWTADKVSQSTQNNFRQLQAEFEEKYIQAAPIETQGSPQETVAQKEPSQNKSEVALLAERLGFKGETVTGLEKIIPKILFIFNIIQTRKNTEYDPRTIKITKEDGTEQIVDVYAEALKYESIILGLAQILQNKTDLEDPFAYAASVEEFEQSFINPIQKLITKMDERIQEIDVQVEAEELAVIQTENAVDNSENEVQPLDLKTLYVLPQKEVFLLHTESDTKKKQKEAAEKNNNTQVDKIKELIAGKPFKEQKKILKATIAPLKKDIDGDIKILDSVAEDVKAIIIKKGLTDKINIEEENVFSQENIGLIRIHLKDNAPLLARLLKVEALIKKISRKAALLSNLSIVLE